MMTSEATQRIRDCDRLVMYVDQTFDFLEDPPESLSTVSMATLMAAVRSLREDILRARSES